MTVNAKASGAWHFIKRLYVKNSGSWIEPAKTFVKISGSWKLQHAVLSYNSTVYDLNLATILGNPTNAVTVVVLVGSSGIIGASSTGNAGLDTGALPSGSKVYIINQGYIVGAGGQGGPGNGGPPSNGLPGGDALNLQCDCILDNTGGVIGGGGGGGGGEAFWPAHSSQAWGGGGGAGSVPGAGGAGSTGGGTGNVGTLTTGGAQTGQHCLDGKGGDLGQAGDNSASCDAQPGATGGVAGYAIRENGHTLTTIAAGTTYGTIA